VGLAIIGLIALGIYMVDLPRGDWRSTLYGWHKVIGTTVLLVAAARILWRWRNGLPEPASDYPEWQHALANAAHVALLIATIALPVTGAIYSYAGGYPVPVLGLFELKSATKYPALFDLFKLIHGWAGWVMAAIIALHVAGALKHHFADRDGTLKRMLGARIG
jgi:cytochrome b561